METKTFIIIISAIIVFFAGVLFFVVYFYSSVGSCGDDYILVCGEDGVTYTNECSLLKNGSTFLYVGECKSVQPIPDSIEFNFDIIGDGSCSINSGKVCGVDDVTYDNNCGPYVLGIDIAYYGECLGDVFSGHEDEQDKADDIAFNRYAGLEDIPEEDIEEPMNEDLFEEDFIFNDLLEEDNGLSVDDP